MADDRTRERYGMQRQGPVLRDSIQLIRDRNADAAALVAGGPFVGSFITPTAYLAIAPASNQLQTARITTGAIDVGSGDGVEFFFAGAGADNATAEYAVLAYEPVFATSDTGKQTVTGFWERIIAMGGFTLSTITVGAAGVAAMPGGTGIVAGDRVADSITQIIPADQSNLANVPNVEVIQPGNATANSSPATLRVIARGSKVLRVLTRVVTATAAYSFGRRLQGESMR